MNIKEETVSVKELKEIKKVLNTICEELKFREDKISFIQQEIKAMWIQFDATLKREIRNIKVSAASPHYENHKPIKNDDYSFRKKEVIETINKTTQIIIEETINYLKNNCTKPSELFEFLASQENKYLDMGFVCEKSIIFSTLTRKLAKFIKIYDEISNPKSYAAYPILTPKEYLIALLEKKLKEENNND